MILLHNKNKIFSDRMIYNQMFQNKFNVIVRSTRLWLFKCSKTIRKIVIFLEKNMDNFYNDSIFLSKNIFFQVKLFIENKYLYPLSKNLILFKKISLSKKNRSV